jgi:hypothetical protein
LEELQAARAGEA